MNEYENDVLKEEDVKLRTIEIQKCRHKAEKRWYRRLVVLNILIIVFVVAMFIGKFEKNSKKAQETMATLEESFEKQMKGEQADTEFDTRDLEDLPAEVQLFFGGILMLIILPFAINVLYASYKVKSVRITQRNFPEVYEKITEYSNKLGLKKVPEAYIVQENGILNAFSAFILKKQYIQISADLFEIAYREHNDLDSVCFVIAHELSHIRLKHATFFYNLFMLYSSGIPILGSAASRAREYSCDRLAQKVTGLSGIDAMMALIAGKHLYKQVDVEDYLEHANHSKGFFVWCYNLACDHPIMTKRIKALVAKEGSGELY